MLKAVILIGGPQKGTRFRPLSLDTPKPLFPIAGLPLIQHHIEACVKLEECKEILIIGSYTTTHMAQFVSDMQKEYHVIIRYLQEFTPLGTGGGLYHFRDQVRAGNPAAFFLLNGDVCADFPLKALWEFHEKRPEALVTIMGTEATRQQSVHYGCMALEAGGRVSHYVEKPRSYVATLINCGVYACSPRVFAVMADAFRRKEDGYYSGASGQPEYMSWEQDVLAPLAGSKQLYAMQVSNWWSQLKTAGSAIYANRHYLQLRSRRSPPPRSPRGPRRPRGRLRDLQHHTGRVPSPHCCSASHCCDRSQRVGGRGRDGAGRRPHQGVHRTQQRHRRRTRARHALRRWFGRVRGRLGPSGGDPLRPRPQQALRQDGQQAAVQRRRPPQPFHHYPGCRRGGPGGDDPPELYSVAAQAPHAELQARNYFIVPSIPRHT